MCNASGDDDAGFDTTADDRKAFQKWSHVVNPKKKARVSPRGSSDKRNRKLIYPWNLQSEVSALIAAVRRRRALWDSSCSEYKIGSVKSDCWREVAAQLAIPGVNAFEARNKWNVVRSLFKANMVKLRSKKSGKASSETGTVPWVHFNEMMFIESVEGAQSTTSTPTVTMEAIYTDTCALSDLSQTSTSQSSGPRRKNTVKPKEITPRPTTPAISAPSPSLSSHSNSGSVRDLVADVLTSLHTRVEGDRLTSFGQLVERNLRSLPRNESLQLEGRIMHVMYEFLGSRTTSTANMSDPLNITRAMPQTAAHVPKSEEREMTQPKLEVEDDYDDTVRTGDTEECVTSSPM